MTNRILTAALAAALLAGPAFAGSHAMSTEEVVNKHLAAFGALDVEALLEDYTDDSSFISPMGTFTGREELRGLFEAFVAEFSKPGMTMQPDALMFEGNTGFLVWHGETADNIYEFATDTYVVEDGKIVSQTFAAKITPK